MLEGALIEQAAAASVVVTNPPPAHVAVAPGWYRPLSATCVLTEAARQHLEPVKVLGVLLAENGRVGQFSANTNGTYDIGPMQINTVHLPDLAATYATSTATIAQLLAYDGCFNVAVGAWLLRKRTDEAGGDFWRGIGRYHNKKPELARRYILRVHAAMKRAFAAPASPNPASRDAGNHQQGN